MTRHDDADSTSIDIRGIPLAYEVHGESTPILLVHGWSADRDYMLADFEPIFTGHPEWRRIYLDLPGHGSTLAPGWLSTQGQMLWIVRDFIEALQPDAPLAIVGSSYGGAHRAGPCPVDA